MQSYTEPNQKKNAKRYAFLAFLTLFITFIISFFVYPSETVQENAFTSISFSSEYLPSIDTGHYALWGINENNEKILLKRFNFLNNKLVSLNLNPLDTILIEGKFIYNKYEITVEKVGDRDEIQSNCILYKGERVEDEVNFQIFPININELKASFILATPTDGTEMTNEKSGIWFTDKINGDETESSLSLNVLPECWKWSAYAVYRDNYLQIGSFNNPNQKDSLEDYSYFQQNPLEIPGEDFLSNLPDGIVPPINIAQNDNKVLLSIEPTSYRLKLTYEPFWPVLEYNFSGQEQEGISVQMVPVNIPELKIVTSFQDK